MASIDFVQTAFIQGVLTPKVRGRLDQDGLFQGAEILNNVVVLQHGGVLRRSGTRYIAASTSTEDVRLFDFRVSAGDSYVIEGGEKSGAGFFRFYADRAQVLDGSSNPLEVAVPYSAAEMKELMFAQSADIMFIAHKSHKPRELRRTAVNVFTLVEHEFKDGPYLEVQHGHAADGTVELKEGLTITPSGTTGSVTLTASADLFDAARDVGRLMRISHSAKWGWGKITAVASATSATLEVKADLHDTTATEDWRFGAWYTGNWPQTVAFHEERLWWGATEGDKQRIWGSKVGDFNNHEPSDPETDVVADNNAISVTLASNTINHIAWLVSVDKGALIGTSNVEFLLRPASSSKGLTPDNLGRGVQSQHGSERAIQPALIGGAVFFVQRGGTEVVSSDYDFNRDRFLTGSLSEVAEHLFRKGVKRLTYQQSPYPILWTLTDGQPVGCTISPLQRLFAWHPHQIGGADVVVEDIAVIPGKSEDELWLAVRRTINGSTVRYIEVLDEFFDDTLETDAIKAFFVDSGISGTFPEGTEVIAGLDHLEGEEVQIVINGAVHPPRTVVGGEVTLASPIKEDDTLVHIGLQQPTIRVKPFAPDTGVLGGTTVGKIKRPHKAHLRFLKTVGATIKTGMNEDVIPFRNTDMAMDKAVPLFTGIKSLAIEARHDVAPEVEVLSDVPLPFHLLNVIIEGDVHGG